MTPEKQAARIAALEVALIDCKAEYLLLLDTNPDIAAWTLDELSREDQDRYRKDAREGLEIEEPIMTIQLQEAEAKITELEKKNDVLEAQVAALKKIAISERSGCIRTESYDHCEGMYAIDLPEAIESSRRQLAEEHPEVDWK